jgi:hypothetical protein
MGKIDKSQGHSDQYGQGANMYESAYKLNKETGRCIIELALDGYHDVFHEWDNASYKRRDLHPELTGFLDMCSEDIPLKKELEIRIQIVKESRDQQMEAQIRQSYENYYGFFIKQKKKKINRNFRGSAMLALVGITFIFLYSLLSTDLPNEIWYDVPLKGLYIGGYVFFWEALYNGYFGSKELIYRNKELARLRRADLQFIYT